jgi:MSHA biogenesis protein MshL
MINEVKIFHYKKIAATVSAMFFTLIFSACAVQEPSNGVTTNKIADIVSNSVDQNQQLIQQNQDIPDSVSNALLPTIKLNVHDQNQALQTYDMVVNNAPAATFFQSLAKDTNDNLIVSPQVTGNISLNIHHMTLPQILLATHQIYGYRFEKTSYGYNIYPQALMTKIFHVSYIDMERNGTSETTISAGSIISKTSTTSTTSTATTAPASSVTTKFDNQFWTELRSGVAMIIGQPSSAATVSTTTATTTTAATTTTTSTASSTASAQPPQVVTVDSQPSVLLNPQAGIVIVRAYPDQLDRVAKYLRDVENIMHREVMINAKILEVQLNSDFRSGIDWTVLGVHQDTTGNISTGLPKISDAAGLTFNAYQGSLSAAVTLLSTQGRVNTLSSPRIATVNNQKALIKVGGDDFFITGITSNTTTSTATTTSANVTLTPFFSGIALDVTPEISNQGDITLHIHPLISSVTSKITTYNLGTSTSDNVPLASSLIRESDNVVRVKNNEIILIGGMMEDQTTVNAGGTPFVSKIPVLGNLFKRQDRTGGKKEIVILLQPKLIDTEVTNQLLKESAEQYSDMNDDFSFDTLFPNTTETKE